MLKEKQEMSWAGATLRAKLLQELVQVHDTVSDNSITAIHGYESRT